MTEWVSDCCGAEVDERLHVAQVCSCGWQFPVPEVVKEKTDPFLAWLDERINDATELINPMPEGKVKAYRKGVLFAIEMTRDRYKELKGS